MIFRIVYIIYTDTIKACGMNLGRGGITNEKQATISSNAILQMHYLFVGSPIVYMSRNLLLNKIMENGIQICSNKEKCKDITLSESELTEIWIPFAKSLVDIIMCIGIAPIRFKRVDKKMVPYVPKAGSYSIRVTTTVDGICTYDLHDMDNPQEPAPNSIVLYGFGYDPRSNGSLTSLIKVLEPTMKFMSSLSDCAMTAEQLRCNPPIIVEKKETSTEMKEGLDFDFFMDSDSLKSSINSQYQRDEKAIQRLKHQQRLFANAITGASDAVQKNTNNTMNNIVPLPSSFRVGTQIEPSGRNDYTQIMRSCAENVCSLLGVPRSLLISDNAVVRGDIEGTHESFKTACLVWKGIVSKVLTLVYRHVFKEEEVARLSKIAKKRKIKDISKLTDNDLMQVIVPVTPYISNEELKQLYLQQIIDWKTYKQYTLRNCSLPIELVKPNEPDPWSKEEKLLMMGVGKKNDPQNPASTTPAAPSADKKPKTDKTTSKVKAANSGKV